MLLSQGMKNAADFRQIARDALSDKWTIAILVKRRIVFWPCLSRISYRFIIRLSVPFCAPLLHPFIDYHISCTSRRNGRFFWQSITQPLLWYGYNYIYRRLKKRWNKQSELKLRGFYKALLSLCEERQKPVLAMRRSFWGRGSILFNELIWHILHNLHFSREQCLLYRQ